MKNLNLIFLLLLTFASGCRQNKNNINEKNNLCYEKDSFKNNYLQYEIVLSNEVFCVRGVAKPIISKRIFSNTEFELQSDSISGIEKVFFDNGEKLTIKNWGCEYYCLTFIFETRQFDEDTTNLEFWFKKVVSLMNFINNGIESPINIKKGIKELEKYIEIEQQNNYVNLKLRQEIDFGNEEVREYLSVDRIHKKNNKDYLIEVTFVTGPL